MQIDPNVGQRIKKARIKAGLTQKQLAECCGLATGTIQQYELGKRYPKNMTITEKIASSLNTTSLYIMWGISQELETFDSGEEFNKRWDEVAHAPENANTQTITIKYKSITDKQIIEQKFNLMNKTGQRKLAEYAEDLSKIPEYRAESSAPSDQDE